MDPGRLRPPRIVGVSVKKELAKKKGTNRICVLDRFHRNKKLTVCIKDGKFLEPAGELLFSNRIEDLLECIEVQINSTEDPAEQEGLREPLRYYTENKKTMTGPYDRGVVIPETREPGVIHTAL